MSSGQRELQAPAPLILTAGSARAEVVPAGGGLRSLTAAGRDIVDRYASNTGPTAGRGQILMPWPNRLGDGRFMFDGTSWELPLNDRPGRNAIHGLVRWLSWTLTRTGEGSGHATCVLAPQPGWPAWLQASATYVLRPGGLTITLAAVNSGPAPCPFGAGMHPYIRARNGHVDDVILTLPSARTLRTDGRGLPTRWEDVAEGPEDFRRPRRVGPTALDACWAAPAGGWQVQVDDVSVWADAAFGYVQVFTGDADPDPARRRTALAVEPMTCPPDAFRTGEGLRRLEPGERWEGRLGIEFPA